MNGNGALSSMDDSGAVAVCLNFMRAWSAQNWEKLTEYSQITWVEKGHHDLSAIKWFETWFSGTVPYGWTVESTESVGAAMIEVKLAVHVDSSGFKKTITVNVICEEETFKPSLKGTWGVNPVSCLGWLK